MTNCRRFSRVTFCYKIVSSHSDITILRTSLDLKENHVTEKIGQIYKKSQGIQAELQKLEQEHIIPSQREIVENSSCVATTLAKLITDPLLHPLCFDAVFIDEVSMAPLLYILAGSKMGSRNIILAGDPKQLPPIFQSPDSRAKAWFGTNLYEYLAIRTPDRHQNVTFLNEQYRMGNQISQLVSNLSYAGQLQPHRSLSQQGQIYILFTDKIVPEQCLYKSYFSITEKSYYYPLSLFLISNLVSAIPHLQETSALLLSPFRAQEKLFSKLCYDLPMSAVLSSSTIHRSQGSECETVFLDLTIHDPQTQHQFFQDAETAKKLLNVALSRAKHNLIVLCDSSMLSTLGAKYSYYRDFYKQIIPYAEESESLYPLILNADNFVKGWLSEIEHICDTDMCFYAALPSDSREYLHTIAEAFKTKTEQSPVLVVRNRKTQQGEGYRTIYRQESLRNIPPMVVCGSTVFLSITDDCWIKGFFPDTARVLRDIAARHLLEKEIDLEHEGEGFIVCQYCQAGNMELTYIEETFRMRCANPNCRNTRWIRYDDLRILAKIYKIRCPNCFTEMTPRQNKRTHEFFFGCMNHPSCQGTRSLYEFASKIRE